TIRCEPGSIREPCLRKEFIMPDRFPIYRLSSDEGTVSQLASHGRRLFNITDDFQLSQRGSSRILRNGRHVVEVAGESGGAWSADESQLWKPGLRPQLLSGQDAAAKAEKLVAEQQLLPKLAAPFRFGKPAIGGTRVSSKDVQTQKREDRRL